MLYVRAILIVILLSQQALAGFFSKTPTNDCFWRLFNANARQSAEDYAQSNDRLKRDYVMSFGESSLQGLKQGDTVIDVGSGYGLFLLDLIQENKIRGIAINAQNNLKNFENLQSLSSSDWLNKIEVATMQRDGAVQFVGFDWVRSDRVQRLCVSLGLDPGIFDELLRMPKDAAKKIFKKRLLEMSDKIAEHKKSGQLVYDVGYAEETLSKYKNQATLITDLWGAYSYSPARVQLLEEYYNALKVGGKGHILVPVYAKSGFFYNPTTTKFQITLEDFLVEKYPNIFKLRSLKSQFSESKVLEIVRDPNVAELKINLKLKNHINAQESRTKEFAPPIIEYEKIE